MIEVVATTESPGTEMDEIEGLCQKQQFKLMAIWQINVLFLQE